MPHGPGTYGSQVGRPTKKKKKVLRRLPRQSANAEGEARSMGEAVKKTPKGVPFSKLSERERREAAAVEAALLRKNPTQTVRGGSQRYLNPKRQDSSKMSELQSLLKDLLSERRNPTKGQPTAPAQHSIEQGEVEFDPARKGQERGGRKQVSKKGPIVRIARRQ